MTNPALDSLIARLRAEVRDKLGVICNGARSLPLQRAVVRQQCEDFLVEFVEREVDRLLSGQQEELEEPNIWKCETCGFVVTKAFLRASDGAVGIDKRDVEDVCPNDGTSLRRQTFKESADEASKFAVDLMNRLNEANQLLEKNEPAYVKLQLKYERAVQF